MTFEGDVKEIPIKGIERAGSDNLCADGAMNEVIGLEYKDGSYVPYVGKEKNNVLLPDNTIKTWCHKTSSIENTIALDSSGNVWWSNSRSTWSQISGLSNITDIKFVGNMLCAASEFVSSYIFYNNTYRMYSEFDPSNVKVTIGLESGIYNKEDGHLNNVSSVYRVKENNDSVELGGLYDRAKSYLRGLGGIYGTVFIAYGWRTNTGEIKCVSQVKMYRENMPYYNTVGGIIGSYSSKYAAWWTKAVADNNVFSAQIPEIEEGVFEDNSNSKIFEIYKDSTLSSGKKEKYSIAKNNELPPFVLSEFEYTTYGNESTHKKIYSCVMNGQKLHFTYSGDVDFSKTDIRSLCIFMSSPVDKYEFPIGKDESIVSNNVITVNNSYTMTGNHNAIVTSHYPKFKSSSDFSKDIADVNALYLVKEIYVDDLISGSKTYVDLSGKLTSMEDNTAQQTLETLKINDMVEYSYRYPKIATYNSRLHLFDVMSGITFDGSDFVMLFGNNNFFTPDKTVNPQGVYNKVKFVVEIKNTDGTFTYAVKQVLGVINSDIEGFCQFVSVNIPNANKIIIQYYGSYGFSETEFVLKKNNLLGISYYVDSTIESSFSYIHPTHVNSWTDYEDTEKNSKHGNMLAVSETYNTTLIDEKNIYTVGDGSIIGVATLSTALSQDTFGKYPLLVFCTDGIYSLPIDESGQSAYSSVPAPFSREVCVSRNTICEIDGGVLFASNKGLMLASSDGVSMFTPNLNGEIKFKQKASVSGQNRDGSQIYGDMINNASIVQLSDAISNDDFIKYLQLSDTTLSYVSNKNKVIVYNKTRCYIYWIDIPTRNTTKLNLNVWFDNNNFPVETYFNKDSNGVYTSYDFEYLSQDLDNDCMFQMRPIKIAEGLKTSFRVEMQGFFSSSNSSKWADLVVLGSLDGEHWYPIGIKEKKTYNGFHNFGCTTDRVSCNYLMIMFAGNLSKNSHIDRIILSCERKYNNKLKV